jgi:hypothetical protein
MELTCHLFECVLRSVAVKRAQADFGGTAVNIDDSDSVAERLVNKDSDVNVNANVLEEAVTVLEQTLEDSHQAYGLRLFDGTIFSAALERCFERIFGASYTTLTMVNSSFRDGARSAYEDHLAEFISIMTHNLILSFERQINKPEPSPDDLLYRFVHRLLHRMLTTQTATGALISAFYTFMALALPLMLTALDLEHEWYAATDLMASPPEIEYKEVLGQNGLCTDLTFKICVIQKNDVLTNQERYDPFEVHTFQEIREHQIEDIEEIRYKLNELYKIPSSDSDSDSESLLEKNTGEANKPARNILKNISNTCR